MTKEPPPEFSFQVHRGARRIHMIAAACGAPAMVLAIAVFVLAVTLAVHWLPSELPRPVSTPRPAGASLVHMTRRLPDPHPISTAAESSRTVVS